MGERSVLDNMGLHPVAVVGDMTAVAPRAARLPHWSILARSFLLFSPVKGRSHGGAGRSKGRRLAAA